MGTTDYGLRLDHIALRVRELAKAVAFYCEVFDMTIISQVGHDYAHLSFYGPCKTLSLIEDASTSQASMLSSSGGNVHFAIEATSFDAFYRIFKRLRSAGAGLKLVDHDVTWAIYTEDPDGHKVEVFVWRCVPEEASKAAWGGATRFLADETIEEEYLRQKQVE